MNRSEKDRRKRRKEGLIEEECKKKEGLIEDEKGGIPIGKEGKKGLEWRETRNKRKGENHTYEKREGNHLKDK